MITYGGKSVSDAVAIGRLCFYSSASRNISRRSVTDTAAEKQRFYDARDIACEQLDVLYKDALSQIGETGAMILLMHQLMLNDENYTSAVEKVIEEEHMCAEYAISAAAEKFAQMFGQMDSEYMRARAADITDVSERVLTVLSGANADSIHPDEPVIIVADDLAPSQTIQLDKSNTLGFVTFHGSTNSHTAILARTMNLPALVGTGEISSKYNGAVAAINGIDGTVIIEPDEETLEKMCALKEDQDEKLRLLSELKGKPNITKDGREIQVYANISGPSDIELIKENDAGGIGLFRTEFLYMENNALPTEEKQFEVYREIVQRMDGKRVIIRTLDIGADKTLDYFGLDHEINPALGYRAIRICLTRPEIFKTQLRAIFRASVYGSVSVMFPMISSLAEVVRIKRIVDEVKAELKNEGTAFDENLPLGVMIETPAAALISEELAKEVDFFSIGTNDLAQYTLAIDRQNERLDEFFDPHHKAVLALIRMTAENAGKAGIKCGICGELGADTALTEQFILMGIDELSVSPPSVLKVRKRIRSLDLSDK